MPGSPPPGQDIYTRPLHRDQPYEQSWLGLPAASYKGRVPWSQPTLGRSSGRGACLQELPCSVCSAHDPGRGHTPSEDAEQLVAWGQGQGEAPLTLECLLGESFPASSCLLGRLLALFLSAVAAGSLDCTGTCHKGSATSHNHNTSGTTRAASPFDPSAPTNRLQHIRLLYLTVKGGSL